MPIMHGGGGLLAVDRRCARSASRVRLAGGVAPRENDLAGLTTHVLDVTSGRPAGGVRVELYELASGLDRKLIADVVTNADGRTDKPLISGDQASAPGSSSSSSTPGTISAAGAQNWPTRRSST